MIPPEGPPAGPRCEREGGFGICYCSKCAGPRVTPPAPASHAARVDPREVLKPSPADQLASDLGLHLMRLLESAHRYRRWRRIGKPYEEREAFDLLDHAIDVAAQRLGYKTTTPKASHPAAESPRADVRDPEAAPVAPPEDARLIREAIFRWSGDFKVTSFTIGDVDILTARIMAALAPRGRTPGDAG